MAGANEPTTPTISRFVDDSFGSRPNLNRHATAGRSRVGNLVKEIAPVW